MRLIGQADWENGCSRRSEMVSNTVVVNTRPKVSSLSSTTSLPWLENRQSTIEWIEDAFLRQL